MAGTEGIFALPRRHWLVLTAGLWLLPAQAALHERRQLFGGPADLLVPPNTPEEVIGSVWHGLAQMNQRWNAWKPGDVSAVNRAFAAGLPIEPTPAVRALIDGATAVESLSLGHFNAGIGALVARWGFHADVLEPGTRPPAADLQAWGQARPSLFQIERRGSWLRSRNPGLQLDFGGYAKGVALDWALNRLMRAGIDHAVLNLGGNLAAMASPATRPWQIGVRDPFGPGLIARLSTRGREAVVTSGIYERYRLLDGVRCAHVMDPSSGEPVKELVSVTVVHHDAALADAAATALLVAGPRRWQRVARHMGVEHVLLVDRHGHRQATAALSQRLQWLG